MRCLGRMYSAAIQGPGPVSDSEDRCLDFVGLIGGCFEVLYVGSDNYGGTPMGSTVWVVTVVQRIFGYFYHSSIGKVFSDASRISILLCCRNCFSSSLWSPVRCRSIQRCGGTLLPLSSL